MRERSPSVGSDGKNSPKDLSEQKEADTTQQPVILYEIFQLSSEPNQALLQQIADIPTQPGTRNRYRLQLAHTDTYVVYYELPTQWYGRSPLSRRSSTRTPSTPGTLCRHIATDPTSRASVHLAITSLPSGTLLRGHLESELRRSSGILVNLQHIPEEKQPQVRTTVLRIIQDTLQDPTAAQQIQRTISQLLYSARHTPTSSSSSSSFSKHRGLYTPKTLTPQEQLGALRFIAYIAAEHRPKHSATTYDTACHQATPDTQAIMRTTYEAVILAVWGCGSKPSNPSTLWLAAYNGAMAAMPSAQSEPEGHNLSTRNNNQSMLPDYDTVQGAVRSAVYEAQERGAQRRVESDSSTGDEDEDSDSTTSDVEMKTEKSTETNTLANNPARFFQPSAASNPPAQEGQPPTPGQ